MNSFGCDKGSFWQILEHCQNSKDINQIRTACLHCLYVLGLVTHIYRRFEKSGCAELAKNVVLSHLLRSESGFSVSEAAGRGDRKAAFAELKVGELHSFLGRHLCDQHHQHRPRGSGIGGAKKRILSRRPRGRLPE